MLKNCSSPPFSIIIAVCVSGDVQEYLERKQYVFNEKYYIIKRKNSLQESWIFVHNFYGNCNPGETVKLSGGAYTDML